MAERGRWLDFIGRWLLLGLGVEALGLLAKTVFGYEIGQALSYVLGRMGF